MDEKDLQAISNLLDKKLAPMGKQIDGLQTQMNGLSTQVNGLQTQVNGLQTQTNENTQILKALEEASRVHKADMDNLTHQVAALSGEVAEVRKDLSRIEIATAENWTDIAKLKAVK